jgi:hypothetical protein
MLSHRYWKGNEVFGKEGASTQLQLYLPVLRIVLHFGIIFTHILCLPKGEIVWERAYISLTSIRFWRFMPKGEKVWAQSKRTAPPPNFKKWSFSNLLCSKGGESSIFKTCKTHFNTKRRYLGGVLLKSKEKHLKQGRKFRNLENASFNLIHVPLTICKMFWKEFYKGIAKTKPVVQMRSKILNKKKTIHAHLLK